MSKCCNRRDHLDEYKARGVAVTIHCIHCAVWHAADTLGDDEHHGAMLAWAWDVADISSDHAEVIAQCAQERPYLFRAWFRLGQLGDGV
jgi:hypothetical protein